jgi:hypothetical protein
MKQLKDSGVLSMGNAVSHVYQLGYELQISAMMQLVFEGCQDRNLEDLESNYCSETLPQSEAKFTLWERAHLEKTCNN